ncbi:MAG: DUF4276 family protein [Polyangiaceae bacterium]|jgi:hypothetical protein|nr:DUF4276 family protein [Polyangiaceae bacterium]
MVKKRGMVKVFVEGGGDDNETRTNCRQGFSEFFRKLLPGLPMPRVVSCGPREQAWSDFQAALHDEKVTPVLLVDAEGPVRQGSWWRHLEERDCWKKPAEASEEQVLLMIQCMESWLLADVELLRNFYGEGFNEKSIPKTNDLADVDKQQLNAALKNATRHARTKGEYHKTKHGLVLVGKLNPRILEERAPHVGVLAANLRMILSR